MNAEILRTNPERTGVCIFGINDDWQRLADDSHILYEGGEYTEKID
ncbi:MAG: hypothetical protein IJ088_08945 [Clostridia bacterium]|nr:hypothetical protein [Clostridia bacterium]